MGKPKIERADFLEPNGTPKVRLTVEIVNGDGTIIETDSMESPAIMVVLHDDDKGSKVAFAGEANISWMLHMTDSAVKACMDTISTIISRQLKPTTDIAKNVFEKLKKSHGLVDDQEEDEIDEGANTDQSGNA